MKIVLLADSTAGHILPCIKIAEKLGKDNEVKIISFDRKIPHQLLDENQVFLKPFTNIKNYRAGLKEVRKYPKETVFISLGGRIGLVILGLYIHGYKNLYIYELNAIFGQSNKILLPFVKKAFTYFPLKGKKCINIGSPLEVEKTGPKIDRVMRRILFLTGSNGSEEMFNIAEGLDKKKYQIVVSTGIKERKFSKDIKSTGRILPMFYSDYDIIIARSGAGTIADIFRYHVPAIFLPSKNVKNDHQKKNILSINKVITVPYLDYKDQNAIKLSEMIEDYKDYNKRLELVSSYDKFLHDDVINKLYNEIKG